MANAAEEVPAHRSGYAQRREAQAEALRQMQVRAGAAHFAARPRAAQAMAAAEARARAADRRVRDLAAPEDVQLAGLAEWCDVGIASIPLISSGASAAVLILDGLRRGPEAASAAIDAIPALDRFAEYQVTARLLDVLDRRGVNEVDAVMVRVKGEWWARAQGLMAAARGPEGLR
jgi:hypothetical protein